MNLEEFLKFLPLIAAGFLAYHLVFKQQLPGKGLVSILTYFLGIIIIFGIAALLITNFLANWTYNLVQEGSTEEWQKVIQASEDIVEQGLGIENTQSSIQSTPEVITNPNATTPGAGQPPITTQPDVPAVVEPRTYVVVTGDTLFNIAQRYGTTVAALKQANGLTSDIIQPGQVLRLPAASQ